MSDLEELIKKLDDSSTYYKKKKTKEGFEISLIEDESIMEEQWFIDMDFDTPNFYYFNEDGSKTCQVKVDTIK